MIPATTLPTGANVIREKVTLSDATHEPPVVPTSPILKPKDPESDENQRLTTLQVLLNHHASYHIEYEKIYKSSHYSMGLISLHALGGTDSHLTRYASQYETRLTKLSELRRHQDQEYLELKITHENWKQHMGLKMYYEAFCDFFNDQLEMYEVSGRSYGDLINDYVPHLLPAIWVQALHPMIHLGWGLAAPNPQKVARRTIVEGLAYLCHSYKSCDHTTSGYTSLNGLKQNSMSPLQVLGECVKRWSGEEYEVKVKQAAEEGVYAKMQLSDFQKKMDLLMTYYQSELHSLDTLLYINPNNLHNHIRELIELAYFLETCSNNNFFILHAVTGLYALRHIVTYIKDVDNKVKALRYAFKTILAVYIAEGLFGHSVLKKAIEYDSIHPFIDILVSHYPQLPTWDAMIAKTLDTNDDASADTHTIKLVNVAWRDMQKLEYGEEVKRLMHVCAAKRMRRTEKWEWEKEGVETISPVNGVWNKEKDEEKEWVKEQPEEKEQESPEFHDEKHKLENVGNNLGEDTLTPPAQNDLGLATKNAVPSTSSNLPRSTSLNVAMPTPAQVEQFHALETDEYHAAHTGSYHPHLDSERLKKHHTPEYLPPGEYAEANPPPISSTVLNPQDLIPQDESNLAHQGSSHPHLQHINNQHLTR